MLYLAMDQGCNSKIPSSIRSHYEAKERPDPIVMERRDEHSCSTTSSKDVGPCPLVKVIIYVVNVTAKAEKLYTNLYIKPFISFLFHLMKSKYHFFFSLYILPSTCNQLYH